MPSLHYWAKSEPAPRASRGRAVDVGYLPALIKQATSMSDAVGRLFRAGGGRRRRGVRRSARLRDQRLTKRLRAHKSIKHAKW